MSAFNNCSLVVVFYTGLYIVRCYHLRMMMLTCLQFLPEFYIMQYQLKTLSSQTSQLIEQPSKT